MHPRPPPANHPTPSQSSEVLAIADREVFLVAGSSMLRYDVDSGVLEGVDEAVVEAARRGVPRALVVGPSADDGKLLHRLRVRDSKLDNLFDPRTGDRVEIGVPAGYELNRLWFVQWLDDDRFVLISSTGRSGSPIGDLLVCRIAAGRCDVTLDASTWTTEPLLPGGGGVGAELALLQEMFEARGGG